MSEALSAEAIKEIERLAIAANRTVISNIDSEPKGRYVVIKDNVVEYRWAEPDHLDTTLATPESFLEYVRSYDSGTSAVYYNEEEVVFIHDIETRRDRATCSLLRSHPFRLLSEPSKAMSQAAFVRFLRIDLASCFDSPSVLLSSVRNLKFEQLANSGGTIQHGRESMGKTVQANVSGENGIPEDTVLSVPVFDNFRKRAIVACAVEVLVAEQQFRLTPYPGELVKAMEFVLADIKRLLSEDGLPHAYYGSP